MMEYTVKFMDLEDMEDNDLVNSDEPIEYGVKTFENLEDAKAYVKKMMWDIKEVSEELNVWHKVHNISYDCYDVEDDEISFYIIETM